MRINIACIEGLHYVVPALRKPLAVLVTHQQGYLQWLKAKLARL